MPVGFRDEFEFNPNSAIGQFSNRLLDQPGSPQGVFADQIDLLQNGFYQLGKGGLGLAELGAGGLDGELGAAAKVSLRGLRDDLDGLIQSNIDSLSPAGREALAKKWFTTDVDSAVWASPRALVGTITQAVPSTVLTLIPGGIIARATIRAGGSVGLAAGRAAAISGVTEGGLTTGIVYSEIVDGLRNASVEELRTSPRFAYLVDILDMPVADAREQLIDESAAVPISLGAGVGAGVLGALSGRAVGAAIATGARPIRTSAIAEGATEAGQEGIEGVAARAGLSDAPVLQPAYSDIIEQMASGAFAGGVLGGGTGALLGLGKEIDAAIPIVADPEPLLQLPAPPQREQLPAPDGVAGLLPPPGPQDTGEGTVIQGQPPEDVPIYAPPPADIAPAPVAEEPPIQDSSVPPPPAVEPPEQITPPIQDSPVPPPPTVEPPEQITPPPATPAARPAAPAPGMQPHEEDKIKRLVDEGFDVNTIHGIAANLVNHTIETQDPAVADVFLIEGQNIRFREDRDIKAERERVETELVATLKDIRKQSGSRRGPMKKQLRVLAEQAKAETEARLRDLESTSRENVAVVDGVRLTQAGDALRSLVAGDTSADKNAAIQRVTAGLVTLGDAELLSVLSDADTAEIGSLIASQVETSQIALDTLNPQDLYEEVPKGDQSASDLLPRATVFDDDAPASDAQDIKSTLDVAGRQARTVESVIADMLSSNEEGTRIFGESAEERRYRERESPFEGSGPEKLQNREKRNRDYREANEERVGAAGRAAELGARRSALSAAGKGSGYNAKQLQNMTDNIDTSLQELDAVIADLDHQRLKEIGPDPSARLGEATPGRFLGDKELKAAARAALRETLSAMKSIRELRRDGSQSGYESEVEAAWLTLQRQASALSKLGGRGYRGIEALPPLGKPSKVTLPGTLEPEALARFTRAERVEDLRAELSAEAETLGSGTTKVARGTLQTVFEKLAKEPFDKARSAFEKRGDKYVLPGGNAQYNLGQRKEFNRYIKRLVKESPMVRTPEATPRTVVAPAPKPQETPRAAKAPALWPETAPETAEPFGSEPAPEPRAKPKSKTQKIGEELEGFTDEVNESNPALFQQMHDIATAGDRETFNSTLTQYGLSEDAVTTLWRSYTRNVERAKNESTKKPPRAGRKIRPKARKAAPRMEKNKPGKRARPVPEARPVSDPGRGQTADPAVRADGRTGPEGFRVVGEEHLPERGADVDVGPYADSLDPYQREGVQRALIRLLAGKSFLLADGTGAGKTAQMLAVAAKMTEKGKVLIVTHDEKVASGERSSFVRDAERMGIDLVGGNIELTWYSQVRDGKTGQGKYAAVILDESHNLKNYNNPTYKAVKAINAPVSMYVSATPSDTILGMVYYAADFFGQSPKELMTAVGFNLSIPKNGAAKITRIAADKMGYVSDRVLGGIIEQLHVKMLQAGAKLVRGFDIPYEEVRVDIGLSDAEAKEHDRLYNYFDSNEGRQGTNAYRNESLRLTERQKLRHVVNDALKANKAGRKVVIVSESVAPVPSSIPGLAAEWPGFLPEIVRELEGRGLKVGKLYGSAKTKDVITDRATLVQRWQNNELDVMVMTPGSGGTGINLDDTTGAAPRTMLLVTTNWAGDAEAQVIGRVVRRSTLSTAIIKKYSVSESASDGRREDINVTKVDQLIRSQSFIPQPLKKSVENVVTLNSQRDLDASSFFTDQALDNAIFKSVSEDPQTLDTVLGIIAAQSADPARRDLASRLRVLLGNISHATVGIEDMPGHQLGATHISQDEQGAVEYELALANTNSYDATQTLLHEAVHVASHILLETDPRLVEKINRLIDVVRRKHSTSSAYGLTNASEFVAEAYSNPEFQGMLANTPTQGTTAWQKFVQYIKILFAKLGMAQSSLSVLDEIMRIDPLVDPTTLAEREVDRVFNEQSIERRTLYMRQSMRRTYGPAVAAGTDVVAGIGRGFWKSTKDRLNDTALYLMEQRQVEETFGSLYDSVAGNPLTKFYNARRARQVATIRYQKKGQALYEQWEKLALADTDNGRRVSSVMHDATMLQLDPDKPAPEKMDTATRAQYQKLKREWGALPDTFKTLYRDVRDYYEREHEAINDILRVNNLRWLLNSPDTAARVAKIVKTGRDVEARADLFSDPVVAAKVMDEIQNASSLKGPYFPLRRYGDYVVTAKASKTLDNATDADIQKIVTSQPGVSAKADPDVAGRYHFTITTVEFFETRSEASSERDIINDSLTQDGWTGINMPPVDSRRNFMDARIAAAASPITTAMINVIHSKAADDREAQAAIRVIQEATYALLPDTSVRKAQMKRRFIAGASRDMRRNLSNYIINGSHYKASLEHNHAIRESLSDMSGVIDAVRSGASGKKSDPDLITMRKIHDHAHDVENKYVTQRETGKWEQRLADLGFFWYLASASYTIVNSTQPIVFTLPYLAARSSHRAAAVAMTKAYKAVTPGVWGKQPLRTTGRAIKGILTGQSLPSDIMEYLRFDEESGNLTVTDEILTHIRKQYGKEAPTIERVISALGEQGLLDISLALDMRETSAATSVEFAGKSVREGLSIRTKSAMEAARVLPHAQEVINRIVTAVAATEVGKGNKLTGAALIDFAVKAVADTQFDYNSMNDAKIFSAPIPFVRLALQFKKHVQHVYYLLIRNSYQAVRGGTKEEKIQAFRTVAGVLVMHGMFAGAIGMTPEPIKWAIGLAMSVFGDDVDDFETEMRNAILYLTGGNKTAAEVLSRGLLRPAGIDMSSRLGIDHMLTFGEPRGDDSDALAAWLFKTAAGPVASIGWNAVDAFAAFQRGDIVKGFERSTPKVMRDAIKAVAGSERGILDTRGNVIFDSDDYGPLQFFYQTVGFTPANVAEMYEQRNAVKGRETELRHRRARLLEKYNRPGDKQGILKDISDFNRRYGREAGVITRSSLIKSSKKKHGISAEATYGRTYTKNPLARNVGAFANR